MTTNTHVWLANTDASIACERSVIAVVCDKLMLLRGERRVVQRFRCLTSIVALPWLDQPQRLEATRLIFEVHEAWEVLSSIRARHLFVHSGDARESDDLGNVEGQGLRSYLSGPLHELAVFAATTAPSDCLRVATRRELVTEPSYVRWRVLQGGRSPGAALQNLLRGQGKTPGS